MTSDIGPILVTGSTGRHGGTGAFVAAELLRRGKRVRALVRQLDARATRLEALGAEVVVGDLRDRRSLAQALAGIQTAFFTWPVAAGIVDAAANFASMGRTSGLRRVVVMSMGAAQPASPSALARAQWQAEELLEWAGFSCVQLRIAAFFFENLELLHCADIEGDGVLRSSFGDNPVNWIAADDAGRVAVAALLDPTLSGPLYPTGTGLHSHAELARALGEHLGRPLSHQTISQEDWARRLLERVPSDARLSRDMAAHISALGAAIRQPLPPNDSFEKLTGHQPLSLGELLTSGRLALR